MKVNAEFLVEIMFSDVRNRNLTPFELLIHFQ